MKIGNIDITPKMVADFGLLIVVAIIGGYFTCLFHRVIDLLERIVK